MLKNIFYRLNTFKCSMYLQEKTKWLKLILLHMHKSPIPVQVTLDDEILLNSSHLLKPTKEAVNQM